MLCYSTPRRGVQEFIDRMRDVMILVGILGIGIMIGCRRNWSIETRFDTLSNLTANHDTRSRKYARMNLRTFFEFFNNFRSSRLVETHFRPIVNFENLGKPIILLAKKLQGRRCHSWQKRHSKATS